MCDIKGIVKIRITEGEYAMLTSSQQIYKSQS